MPTAGRVAQVRAALAAGVPGVRTTYDDRGHEEWHHPDTGRLHRLDGPASTVMAATWYVDGSRHRVDGPAEVGDGYEQWWAYDEVHRVDGPALEYADGRRRWVVAGHDVVRSYEDRVELERLYDCGLRDRLEQVLTVWEPGGPSVVELSAAVAAAVS